MKVLNLFAGIGGNRKFSITNLTNRKQTERFIYKSIVFKIWLQQKKKKSFIISNRNY